MTSTDLVIADLADENVQLRATNTVLIDLIADLAWQNFLLSAVADYRCRHNPVLLRTLARAAARGLAA